MLLNRVVKYLGFIEYDTNNKNQGSAQIQRLNPRFAFCMILYPTSYLNFMVLLLPMNSLSKATHDSKLFLLHGKKLLLRLPEQLMAERESCNWLARSRGAGEQHQ